MFDGQSLLFHLLEQKTPEAWLSMLAGTIYVWLKSGNETRIGKAIESGLAGILSYAISPDIIESYDYPASIVYFLVAAFGFFILDVVSSLIADKEGVKAIVKGFIYKWLKIEPHK